ncbi:MAG TPA: threonine/serine dehydratase [Candidatus Acidoferrum sp.]|nr:threonine/serine dehydratase [Candidatus Acidoferrum sp.]
MVTYSDILAARKRINGRVARTELLPSTVRDARLKLECRQPLGSFKIRGALSKISSLTATQRAAGVIAVSSGNHGAGVSLAARLEGISKAKVYVPAATPKAKTDKIAKYGAEVVRVGDSYDACHAIAEAAAKESGMTMIDPCSDLEVIAGQGTIGLEICEDWPKVDVILVPIGGGGLVTGIAVAAKRLSPDIKVIGVQTAACPAMAASIRDNVCHLEYDTVGDTVCDALVGGVGEIPFAMRDVIDDVLVVEEADIRAAVRSLVLGDHVVAEGAGAVGVAAYDQNIALFEGKNVAIVISGGNIDGGLLAAILTE